MNTSVYSALSPDPNHGYKIEYSVLIIGLYRYYDILIFSYERSILLSNSGFIFILITDPINFAIQPRTEDLYY